jgi:alpha-L-fucosidase
VTRPGWWNERRYGMYVHANIATVASFSPIGERADRYWSHLGSDALTATAPHPSPMAEVLAYHRDRWAHVGRYDDFLPFLSYHRFDPDEHLDLVVAAGMRYIVHVAKHRDGFCWWDAPGTDRSSVHHGPQRDVLAEIASACRRNDITFGASYSLFDWSDARCPDQRFVDSIVHPQVLDLVEHHGAEILLGEGHAGRGDDVWRSTELIERLHDRADAQGLDLALDDGWQSPDGNVVTIRRTPPAGICTRPWQLRRSLGHSPSYNRAERAEHMLTTGGLFDLLTEVIAKGGNLLIDVGPGVDGTIGELAQRPLRAVGAWVAEHPAIVHSGRPFGTWGDAQVRYVVVGEEVVALDLAAGAEVVLAALAPEHYEVASVTADDGGALHWEQHRSGVTVSRIDRSPTGLAGVYRIALRPAVEAIRLFDERVSAPQPLQPLLDNALPGEIVQLRDGVYQGPVEVPPRVTVRGLGWDRTSIIGGSEGHHVTAVVLAAQSRLENVWVTGIPAHHAAAILAGGDEGAISGCRVDGHVLVDAHDVTVTAVIGSAIVVTGDRSVVERCALKAPEDPSSRDLGFDVGIHLTGGAGHRVTRNEVVDHRCAIRADEVSTSVITENRIAGRWWGVHLVQCDHVEVAENQVQHTMRAFDVDGGNGSVITGNWVADGDSGALVQFGATETAVIDNHIERCRVGVIVWDAPTTQLGPNTFIDLHEAEPCVHGPDDVDDADDGG